MKKAWTDAGEVWKCMGWVVVGLACVAFGCVIIHWFQNPELSQMEVFLDTWRLQACGLGLAILGAVMIGKKCN